MRTFCGGDYKEAAYYDRLRACGEDTRIYQSARLIRPQHITIGRGCRIDDFTFLFGGEDLLIDDRVHISSFSSIVGGGHTRIESYAGLSAGCRLITGSENYQGEGLTNPCIPEEFRSVKRSHVTIRKHALLFTNVIVFPGVEIGAGSVVSAASIVSHDLDPWGIYRMKNGRLFRVKDRPCERILELEQQCIARYGY